MGLVRRWQQARAGAVIAECGAGKTLISLGAVHTHSGDQPFTALVMVPPQLVDSV
jgi:superfamily II DNA or RNA helicase